MEKQDVTQSYQASQIWKGTSASALLRLSLETGVTEQTVGFMNDRKGPWRAPTGKGRQNNYLPPGRPGSTVDMTKHTFVGLFVVWGLSGLLVGKAILKEGISD